MFLVNIFIVQKARRENTGANDTGKRVLFKLWYLKQRFYALLCKEDTYVVLIRSERGMELWERRVHEIKNCPIVILSRVITFNNYQRNNHSLILGKRNFIFLQK